MNSDPRRRGRIGACRERAGIGRAGLGGALLVLLVTGCGVEPSGPRVSGWSRDRLETASAEDAFGAGRYAVSQWFRIARSDAGTGMIISAPSETTERGNTGRIRDEAGYPNRVRRTATLRVQALTTGVAVECHVTRERLDTSDHATLARNMTLDDAPTATPVEREAGVSAEQAQVWTDIGRDREMERRILDVVRSRLERGRPASAPAAADTVVTPEAPAAPR